MYQGLMNNKENDRNFWFASTQEVDEESLLHVGGHMFEILVERFLRKFWSEYVIIFLK